MSDKTQNAPFSVQKFKKILARRHCLHFGHLPIEDGDTPSPDAIPRLLCPLHSTILGRPLHQTNIYRSHSREIGSQPHSDFEVITMCKAMYPNIPPELGQQGKYKDILCAKRSSVNSRFYVCDMSLSHYTVSFSALMSFYIGM